MSKAQHDLGRVFSLKADAVGKPGSRRFYVFVKSASGESATLWIEKEQLFNLAVAIKRVIIIVEQQSSGSETNASPSASGGVPSLEAPAMELEVRRLALGYDEGSGLYTLNCYESEETGSEITVSLTATSQQIDALADESFTVCAAGRPRCFLCGAPLEPGHVCPRHNGHGAALS